MPRYIPRYDLTEWKDQMIFYILCYNSIFVYFNDIKALDSVDTEELSQSKSEFILTLL